MHLVHLALAPDAIISCLLDWSDPNTQYLHGSSRDARLQTLWENYRAYCEDQSITERAQRRLFSVQTLKPDSDKFVEISQKILNASACRYMIFWLASVAQHFATIYGSVSDMHFGLTITTFFWWKKRNISWYDRARAMQFLRWKIPALKVPGWCGMRATRDGNCLFGEWPSLFPFCLEKIGGRLFVLQSGVFALSQFGSVLGSAPLACSAKEPLSRTCCVWLWKEKFEVHE